MRNYTFTDLSYAPRKIKKKFLGKILSKSQIKRRIKSITISEEGWLSDFFCPNCGCTTGYRGHNKAEYPEDWITEYCARCHHVVAEADNSPMVHVLEYMAGKDPIIDLKFISRWQIKQTIAEQKRVKLIEVKGGK